MTIAFSHSDYSVFPSCWFPGNWHSPRNFRGKLFVSNCYYFQVYFLQNSELQNSLLLLSMICHLNSTIICLLFGISVEGELSRILFFCLHSSLSSSLPCPLAFSPVVFHLFASLISLVLSLLVTLTKNLNGSIKQNFTFPRHLPVHSSCTRTTHFISFSLSVFLLSFSSCSNLISHFYSVSGNL